jgi:protein TonB
LQIRARQQTLGVFSSKSFFRGGVMIEGLMFSDTLNTPWQERARRGWTTLTSFAVQAIVSGLLLLLPMLRPTGLPALRQLSTPVSLGQPVPEMPAVHRRGGVVSNFRETEIVFRQPSQIPHIQPSTDDGPPQIGVIGTASPSPGLGGEPDGLRYLADGVRPVPAPPKPIVNRPVQVSQMSEGDLIRKIQPAYPPIARSARIHGAVVLQAVISKMGTIENLRVLSGHPMLTSAAIDAVRQWRYRPYVLNGEPVEVETQITVHFSLTGN